MGFTRGLVPLPKSLTLSFQLPSIGLFLFVCNPALNVGEVMQWELERGLAVPRESSTVQLVMTSLLSTPHQRLKLDTKPTMPYRMWEEKLRIRYDPAPHRR